MAIMEYMAYDANGEPITINDAPAQYNFGQKDKPMIQITMFGIRSELTFTAAMILLTGLQGIFKEYGVIFGPKEGWPE